MGCVQKVTKPSKHLAKYGQLQSLVFTKNKPNKPQQANNKGKGSGKGKQAVTYQQKPKKQNPPSKKKENPNKDLATCHHCNTPGHWKRHCPLFLEELRLNKSKMPGNVASTSDTKSNGSFKGVKLGENNIYTSNLQLADDAKWSIDNVENLSRILRCFNLASALKSNLYKSNMFGMGVSNTETRRLASSLGCQASTRC
ncbi:RNA-directed DNA polymerase, eukaryota, Reverse transcriptase zinc-binding domain protein [Artemisia annua]|uniref:RNA-directed DNA polymerase, eukaryota, Reverse transcriptase zinc-binding domain protein n=1 Tax=Artemisia annua TaxID=35608 RepID=A0A2U1L2D2_ARTAN|nr:RNA-directed DNA polymerase, eukaryota, Reverse transcriptase zinc-binding domain protein [Artemisia annua]